MKLIFLHGLPGVGELMTARALAQLIADSAQGRTIRQFTRKKKPD